MEDTTKETELQPLQKVAAAIRGGKAELENLAANRDEMTEEAKASLPAEMQVYLSMPDNQRQAALQIMETMADNFDRSHTPELKPGGVIRMELMLGGILVINAPNGGHSMAAARLQSTYSEAAKNETIDEYTLVACSEISDKDTGEMIPMAVSDLSDRFTVRDLRVALDAFRSINLL